MQNRAFQAVVPGTMNALNSWQPFNGPRISVTNKTPGVSASLPNSLQVVFPKVVSGPIGFENTGFWGKFAPSLPNEACFKWITFLRYQNTEGMDIYRFILCEVGYIRRLRYSFSEVDSRNYLRVGGCERRIQVLETVHFQIYSYRIRAG